MRIVALDEVPNERGEPTMLGVIGSCRVHHPVQALVRSGRARLLGLPLSTYTHTPDEARQYLSHNLGLTPIPSAFQTYILGEDKISRIPTDVIEMVRRVDVFVVEISSAAQIRCGAYEFQMNYFVRNFVRGGGMSHLNWWRDVTAGSENIAEMAEEALAARGNVAPSDEEILRTAQLITLDDAAFGRSMDALRALHPARWLFVSHVNLSQRDDRLDPRREQSTRQLADYGAKSGVRVLDPTALVLQVGRENALGAGGRDLSHYNPDFELPMGEAISGEVANVLEAPHSARGTAAPERENCSGFFCHCERSEAIQIPSAETVWIASLRSQ